MDKNKSNVLTNYGFWASIASLLYVIGSNLGIIKILPDEYNTIVNLMLSVVMTAGLVSDPKDGKWFKNPGFDVNEIKNKEDK